MIRFPLREKPLKLKGAIIGTGSGPAERIKQLQLLVTDLVRHERIEGRQDQMHETRAYTEQLLNLAIIHGDKHRPTMEMADKWLLEKDLVHKLFKVLVPRYSRYNTAYTHVYTLPAKYPGTGWYQGVLELKGNPYPSVVPHQRETRNLLSNVLVRAASQDYFHRQSADVPYDHTQTNTPDAGEIRLMPSQDSVISDSTCSGETHSDVIGTEAEQKRAGAAERNQEIKPS